MNDKHTDPKPFMPLTIAVLTVSDSRTHDTDTSGQLLVDLLKSEGHIFSEKLIIPDNLYEIRKVLSNWIADSSIEVVITTGGTGLTGRDITPEALSPLLDKEIPGFGELFRSISYQKIRTSSLQSRAMAGIANGTVLFSVPGSNGACKDAWSIIKDQLDIRHKPCNLVEIMPRFKEK